jgi:hypothetical protein
MKTNPYLAGMNARGKLEWMRRAIVYRDGSGNESVGNPQFLRMNDMDIVWASRDNKGYLLLNLDLRQRNGQPVFHMVDNDWEISDGNVSDLEARPQHRYLRCIDKSGEIELALSFSNLERDSYRDTVAARCSKHPAVADGQILFLPMFCGEWVRTSRWIRQWPALLVELTVRLVYPYPISITKNGICTEQLELRGLVGGGNSHVSIADDGIVVSGFTSFSDGPLKKPSIHIKAPKK